MNNYPQFSRNADGFFLEVELTQTLNFLLVSANEDLFYQLRMLPQQIPQELRGMLPSLQHFYLFLSKNYNHPRAFHISQDGRIHITVPIPNHIPISIILKTHQITKDNIMPDDDVFAAELGTIVEIDEFFPKIRNKRMVQCLDLDNTQSSSVRQPSPPNLEEKNKKICKTVERMLSEGCLMGKVKKQLKLKDKTAMKMMRQYKKFKRIFSPQEAKLIRQNHKAKSYLKQKLQQQHQLTAQMGQTYLMQKGICRSLEFISQCIGSTQIVYYSEDQQQSKKDSVGEMIDAK